MQLNGGVHQLGRQLCNVSIKPASAEVAVKDLEVDAAHNVWRRHLNSKRREVALHAGRDVEAARRGVHAGDILTGLDLLQQDLDLVIPAECT